jgi:hypothetical protein
MAMFMLARRHVVGLAAWPWMLIWPTLPPCSSTKRSLCTKNPPLPQQGSYTRPWQGRSISTMSETMPLGVQNSPPRLPAAMLNSPRKAQHHVHVAAGIDVATQPLGRIPEALVEVVQELLVFGVHPLRHPTVVIKGYPIENLIAYRAVCFLGLSHKHTPASRNLVAGVAVNSAPDAKNLSAQELLVAPAPRRINGLA